MKRNLLVIDEIKKGDRMLRAFSADPKEWHVSYFGAPLLGMRFDRAVVVLPRGDRQAAIDFTREVVRLKLPDGAAPEIF